VTGRGPGTGGPGRSGNQASPGNPNGPGRPGPPRRTGAAGRRPGQQPGPAPGQGQPPPGPRRSGDPRAAGPGQALPPEGAAGRGAGPRDRPAGSGPRLDRDRVTGPGARLPEDGRPDSGALPRNARLPGGQGAGRPGSAVPPPGPRGSRRPPGSGARRPPRPPRWPTFKRGEPGRRASVTLLAITIVLTLFAGRLVQLQGMESGRYKKQANAEKLTKKVLFAMRGNIYGSDYGAGGQVLTGPANSPVLAMTVETYSVAADPPYIPDADKPAVSQELAGPLGMPAAQILDLLRHPPDPNSPDYVLLATHVSAVNEEKIAAFNIPDLTFTPSFAPDYPNGTSTANVVGLTSVNPDTGAISGYAGLEEEYNSLLTGTNGSEEVETGLDGPAIPLAGIQATPAVNGESIKLTINPALQYEAQQSCQQEVTRTRAQNCSVVVMQPKTGAILAMAQWPNAGDGSDIAVQNVFAPGSTAKVITAAAAFEHSGVTPMTPYNIPYVIYRGGQAIHDAEWSPGERYTVAGIIANSSNVGMSQVVESVPESVQYQYLRNFGLDEPTGLNLPGESQGLLPPVSQWAADERYTLSYGQGIAVNAVQMASVYATIANGGVRVQPTLIAGTYDAAGRYAAARPSPSKRVIQAKTARELIQILQQVPGVDNAANQRWGDIAGYAIAAKTGTSNEPSSNPKKPCPAANPECVYGSSYIGMAPGNAPGVVVAVNVQGPDTSTDYYGDEVAGPVFYSVMNFALQTLQIQPQPGLVAPYVRLNAR
jgi:cell division protein FtsI (penicillin-binding protein 3)